jgi:hypothetical protein
MIIIMRWRDMCHKLRMFGHRHPQSKLSRQLSCARPKGCGVDTTASK